MVGALLAFAAVILIGLFLGKMIVTTPGQMPLLLLVATVMFVVTFLKADVALIFLIIAMLLSPEVSIGSVPKREIVIRIEDILIIVMGMAWCARSAVRKGMEVFPRTPLNLWIAIYCACFLVATSQGIIAGQVNPTKASFYVLKYLEYFIIFFIVSSATYRKEHYRMYLVAFFLTFMVVNVFAASQIGHVDRVSAPFEGTKGEPNTLGGYQVLMMCVAAGLFCHLRSWRLRLLMAGIIFFTFWPFMHTLSRASYVASAPAFLALIVYNRSRRRGTLIMAACVLVLLGAFFLPDSVKDRVMYTFNARPQADITPVKFLGYQLDPSASARWWDWWSAVDYWREQPFFGYGLTAKAFLDSQYVNNLVETGAAGFLAFAMVIWMLHRSVARIYRTADDDVVRGLALGFLAGNVGILVHALTANTFILIRVMEPYWFMAAMILAWPRIAEGLEAVNEPPEPALAGRRRNIDMLLRDSGGGPGKGGTDAT